MEKREKITREFSEYRKTREELMRDRRQVFMEGVMHVAQTLTCSLLLRGIQEWVITIK